MTTPRPPSFPLRPRPTLGKPHRHLRTTPVFPLPALPDDVLLRVIRFLCISPSRRRLPRIHFPCHPANAFNLATCSRRFLQLFKDACISCVDAVPDKNFLDPLPRSHSNFHGRDPRHLRKLVKLAGLCLVELHLPVYDCSMEDAQWSVLTAVAEHCANLQTLSFVDSFHHACTTPLQAQCAIFAKLLPSVKHLTLYVVREASKLDTMASAPAFSPVTLVLHQIHPKLHRRVIDLLRRQGQSITALTLSFEQVQPEYSKELAEFMLPFLGALSNTIAQYMPNLHELHVLTGPGQNPLTGLPGPSVSTESSKSEFKDVSKAIEEAKARPRRERVALKRLVVDRIYPQLVSAIRLFSSHCDPQTEIEVYLHEVLLVSPANPEKAEKEDESSLPYFRATKLHSSSWMIKDLPPSFFRQVEHIHVGLDEDCSKGSRPWYDRIIPDERSCVNPDMQSFRFLCEKSSSKVKSVFATVPIESAEKANSVLRILSSGFAYARNVSTLALSGDALRYIGLDHSLLYSVIGQLKNLQEMYVSEPTLGEDRKAQIDNLPVLIKGLWMFCQKLDSFKFEFSSFGNACSVQSLRDVLEALREFDRKLPGVETHSLGELLEISLKHCCEEGNLDKDVL